MRDIWLILKADMLASMGLALRRRNGGAKERAKRIGIGAAAVLIVLLLASTVFIYSCGMMYSLAAMDAGYVLLPVMMTVAGLLALISTIYKAGGLLFGFRNYDMLISLPIPFSRIVASRIIILYVWNMAFTLLVMLPALAAYLIFTPVQALFFVFFFLTLLFIPLIPVILASVIGVLVSVVSAGFKHKTLVSTVLMLAFVLGVFYLSFSAQTLLMDFGSIGQNLLAAMNRVYPLAEVYMRAVCGLDFGALAVFILSSAAAFALFCLAAARCFGKVREAYVSVRSGSRFRIHPLKSASPFGAMYKKELKRFASSSLYMLNCGIGIFLLLIAAVAVLVQDTGTLLESMEMGEIVGAVQWIAPFVSAFMLSMVYTSVCSISLEGKNLTTLKALPLSTGVIFGAKIAMNLTLTLPAALVSSVLFIIGLHLQGLTAVMMLVLPLCYCLFNAVFGLTVNLLLPKLDWTNEAVVIKQSAASGAMLLIMMTLVFLPGALCVMFPNPGLVCIVAALSLLALCAGLIFVLKGWGSRRFMQIG